MTKTVTHIDCPKEWESLNDWDSHKPLLKMCIDNTNGNIVEFGSGYGSTDAISKLSSTDRLFVSLENNKEWAEKIGSTFVGDYFNLNKINIFNPELVFIDCAPAEIRKPLIEKWKEIVDVILVHDTEIGSNYVYNLANTLAEFKYRLHYAPKGKPHTTAVSNTIDVTQWV